MRWKIPLGTVKYKPNGNRFSGITQPFQLLWPRVMSLSHTHHHFSSAIKYNSKEIQLAFVLWLLESPVYYILLFGSWAEFFRIFSLYQILALWQMAWCRGGRLPADHPRQVDLHQVRWQQRVLAGLAGKGLRQAQWQLQGPRRGFMHWRYDRFHRLDMFQWTWGGVIMLFSLHQY